MRNFKINMSIAFKNIKRFQHCDRGLLFSLAMLGVCGCVQAQTPAPTEAVSSACDPREGLYELHGWCTSLNYGASYTYQSAQNSGAGFPVIVNKNGTVSSAKSSDSASAYAGLQMTRHSDLGDITATGSASWSKATDDGTQNGSAYVSGWSLGFDGLTVGYTGTLMSFWSGDFLSAANAPQRATNSVVYEYDGIKNSSIAIGLESNLPTTPQTQTGPTSFDFSNPVYTLRWLHSSDEITFFVAGLLRKADYSDSPSQTTTRTGWVESVGVTMPMAFVAEGDSFSTQWTRASDASSYLGTNVDWTSYQQSVATSGPTTGWSAVSSFHHVWSEQFESNIYSSYVTVAVNFPVKRVESSTVNSGINLFWRPKKNLRLGIEFEKITGSVSSPGIPDVSVDSSVGILSMAYDFN